MLSDGYGSISVDETQSEPKKSNSDWAGRLDRVASAPAARRSHRPVDFAQSNWDHESGLDCGRDWGGAGIYMDQTTLTNFQPQPNCVDNGYTACIVTIEVQKMAVLHVRNVPETLYKRVQKIAAEQDKTLSAVVIALLEQYEQDDIKRRKHAKVMAEIRRDLAMHKPNPAAPNAVDMIHTIREAREAQLTQRHGQ